MKLQYIRFSTSPRWHRWTFPDGPHAEVPEGRKTLCGVPINPLAMDGLIESQAKPYPLCRTCRQLQKAAETGILPV